MKTIIIQFLKWCGSVLEDKKGAVSSKRVGFFIMLWIFHDNLKAGIINEQTIWPMIVLIAAVAGLTLPEWFNKINPQQ